MVVINIRIGFEHEIQVTDTGFGHEIERIEMINFEISMNDVYLQVHVDI